MKFGGLSIFYFRANMIKRYHLLLARIQYRFMSCGKKNAKSRAKAKS